MLNKLMGFFSSYLLSCIIVGSLLPSVVASEIPLGSKLSVLDNDLWVSSNGDFALGFFNNSNQPNQYSVGIRFNSDSIPLDKQAVVWVAGAEITVSNYSYFELTSEGELVLSDSSSGGVVWMSNTANKSVSSASLHDDGNFVLLDRNKDIVWQSFDTPSDTLVPGQDLSTDEKLRAASRNTVSSYYTLYMSDLGQLQLKWESNVIYWVNGIPVNKTVRASLNSNGSFHLLDERSMPVWSVFADDHNDNVKFRFLRLDVDGNLRLYSWDEALGSWRSVWQAVENQCDVFATCGDHGVCSFINSSGNNPVCKCPFRSPTQYNSKCLFSSGHSCDARVSMMTYKHTSLYGIYPPNDSVTIASIDQCRDLCLKDPLCTAVTYLNDGTARCRIKTTPYVTGYCDPSLTSLSFVKICLDPFAVLPNKSPSSPPPESSSPPSSISKQPYKLGIDVAVGSVCMFFVLQVAIGFWVYRMRVISVKKQASAAYAGPKSAGNGIVRWTYAEIKEITGNFKHQLGPHSFKAMDQISNQPVVVKKLDNPVEERVFRAMVAVIGSIYHKNMLKLEGYCCESVHRFLVYEFLKKGSLEEYMKDPKLCKRLTWRKRMGISLDVAKAINYLHTECREFVSHGNLKCGNVILDENLEAKVTEFGLMKLDIATPCFASGGEAEKDVEDFGKLVLALISGRQEEDEEDVCEWSYNKWISGYGWRIVDKRIEGEIEFEELERCLRIAYWCLQENWRMRPSMGEVVNVLQGTLTVDPPPPPFSCLQEEGLTTMSELEP